MMPRQEIFERKRYDDGARGKADTGRVRGGR